MDFVYYIVRKKDNVILDGASDMVNAINLGQQQNCACLIMQACIITEVGQDINPEEPPDNFVESEIISDDTQFEAEEE